MSEVIQLARSLEKCGAPLVDREPSIRTDAVYVVFTTIDETLDAVRVAWALAKAMRVPVTVIHFRAVPYPLPMRSIQMLDVFYVAIGAVGFLLLWAITKAFDRV